MSEASKEAPPSIVRDLFEASPSLRFELKRRKEDGSVVVLPFRCRLLRAGEDIEAIEAAQKFATGRELKGYGDIYKEAQSHEIILRTMCREEIEERELNGVIVRRPHQKFVTADQVRASLDSAECAQVLSCYEITKAWFRVSDDMDPEELEKSLDLLADEMMGPLFLGQWDSADWPRLIFMLARMAQSWRPPTSQTPSSSPSSSGSDPSNSESGTTDFSQLPDAQSVGLKPELKPPTDKMLTREEARELVKREQQKPE